ncbi:pantothenate kinase [Malassezia sp. CBS 17886]|nr:pantothenate kinase [Malassezia sp. CBS 17886]
MQAPSSAVPVDIAVTTHGARIIEENTPDEAHDRDSQDIYLPNHIEAVSHIAVDVGGSLAKVVYFSHAPSPLAGTAAAASSLVSVPPPDGGASSASPPRGSLTPSGTLTPRTLIEREQAAAVREPSFDARRLWRRSLPSRFPGGRLNFTKFETGKIDACVQFLKELLERSAEANRVDLEDMRKSVKLMATGGGAHLFYDLFERELGVEVVKEDEMQCLITGLNFMTLITDEVFWYSDELVNELYMTSISPPCPSVARGDSAAQPQCSDTPLPRPSASPPLYAPMFESEPAPKLPCLLVNIGSGVSILRVDEGGKFERVSGTSLGGGTLWGLLGLLTDAQNFDEMLELCSRGDNSFVDMLVGDIYGPVGLDHLGLKATTIASTFGKVLRWDRGVIKDTDAGAADEGRGAAAERRRSRFNQEDICRSLLYAISNNIAQIAHLNAEVYGLDRIYFGGCFIRGHEATIATLSYAIRFWSKGRRRAYFLRHEGYLGAVGAWVRNMNASVPGDGAEREGSEAACASSPRHDGETGDTRSATTGRGDAAEAPPSDIAQGRHSAHAVAQHSASKQDYTGDEAGSQSRGSSPAAGGLPPTPPAERPLPHHARAERDLPLLPPMRRATPGGAPAMPLDRAQVDAAKALDPNMDTLLQSMEQMRTEEASDDPESIASLVKELDAANAVADTVEARVNDILGKIQALLPEGEGKGEREGGAGRRERDGGDDGGGGVRGAA